jgi:phosphoribosylamine--glycine ligase
MRIAVIGSGGREHAIAWSLARHRLDSEVVVLPGNGGIPNSAPVDITDLAAVEDYCRREEIRLVLVGPEAPLAAGMVDRLREAGLAIFGATRDAARLESSKIWAKEFMLRSGVATAEGWTFGEGQDPTSLILGLEGRLVVKYDGLAAGKGVWVCSSPEDAHAAVRELRARHGAGARFLVERKLEGDELSILGITDGRDIRLFPPSQDHKALLDGDQGPNTGGMGAYSPVPQIGPDALRQIESCIIGPTLKGLQKEGIDYRGFIYFGLMLTTKGPRLLEYNVRLGDPEAEVILPLVENDLAELAMGCLTRNLGNLDLQTLPGYAVSVVLASEGYPGKCVLGRPIRGLDRLDPDTLVFHSGTRRVDGQLVTSGGRVLNIVGRGADLPSAIDKAYAEARKVSFEGMQLRTDIGRRTWKRRSPG